MLAFWLRYIYFVFAYLLIFLLVFAEKLPFDKTSIFVVCYFFVILPIIDGILNYIKKDIYPRASLKTSFFSSLVQIIKKNTLFQASVILIQKGFLLLIKYWKIILGGLGLIVLYAIFGENIYNFAALCVLFLSIYCKIDSRISFFIALGFLFFIPLFFILDRPELAETYSVYIGYFMVIGVLVSLLERMSFFHQSPTKKTSIPQIKAKIFGVFLFMFHNYKVVFGDLLVVSLLVLIESFYFDFLQSLLIDLVAFIGIIYLLLRLIGFQFDFHYTKVDIRDKSISHYLMIMFSLLVIAFSGIIQKSTFGSQGWYTLAFSLGGYLLFLGLFTNFLPLLKQFFFRHIYFTLSFSLSGILLIVLWYSNPVFLYFQTNAPHQVLENTQIQTPEIIPVQTPVQEEKNIPPEPIIEEVPPKAEVVYRLDMFDENLSLGSTGEKVAILQGFLHQQGYYTFETTSIFDENTRVAMAKFLHEKCGWAPTNKGFLGPLVRGECLQGFFEQ